MVSLILGLTVRLWRLSGTLSRANLRGRAILIGKQIQLSRALNGGGRVTAGSEVMNRMASASREARAVGDFYFAQVIVSVAIDKLDKLDKFALGPGRAVMVTIWDVAKVQTYQQQRLREQVYRRPE